MDEDKRRKKRSQNQAGLEPHRSLEGREVREALLTVMESHCFEAVVCCDLIGSSREEDRLLAEFGE